MSRNPWSARTTWPTLRMNVPSICMWMFVLVCADVDTLAEQLRRRPAKPMESPRVGSNLTGVVFALFRCLQPVLVFPAKCIAHGCVLLSHFAHLTASAARLRSVVEACAVGTSKQCLRAPVRDLLVGWRQPPHACCASLLGVAWRD